MAGSSDRLAGHRALVTGASSGIGREMARQLAAMGADLVIVARRGDRLEELAAELTEAHSSTVIPVVADLNDADAPGQVWDRATADGPIDICINNAGWGLLQPFADVSHERTMSMVRVNVNAVVDLSHRFVSAARGSERRAYLLTVASTAAFQPIPTMAVYAATKHFVLAFTEGLAAELKGTNVSASCLCPGPTKTEFFDQTENWKLGTMANLSMLDVDKVAALGLATMLKRRRFTVAGFLNKLGAFLTRLGPRSLAGVVAARLVSNKAPPDKKAG